MPTPSRPVDGLDGAGSRPTTLADVAARAGVAVSTVSRALSNPGRVNIHTRERIQQAARELDYSANPSARALSSGHTGAVAVLVSDVTNPFYFDIIRGSQQQLKNAGVTQLLVDTEESAEVEATLLTKLQRSCDGAILTSTRLSDARLDQLAAAMNLVTINRPRRGIGSVVLDTAQGMEQAVEHLVSLGHRRIVYVSGPKGSWSNERRWRAVYRAARRLGADISRTREFPPRGDSGVGAADAVLNTRATACIVYNDIVAIGMLARLGERGVGVPDDLSVVGCDDIFGADFCHPPLTTVTAPIEQAGRVATSILLSGSRSAGAVTAGRPPGSSAVLPTHLTVRRSTGPARPTGGRPSTRPTTRPSTRPTPRPTNRPTNRPAGRPAPDPARRGGPR